MWSVSAVLIVSRGSRISRDTGTKGKTREIAVFWNDYAIYACGPLSQIQQRPSHTTKAYALIEEMALSFLLR